MLKEYAVWSNTQLKEYAVWSNMQLILHSRGVIYVHVEVFAAPHCFCSLFVGWSALYGSSLAVLFDLCCNHIWNSNFVISNTRSTTFKFLQLPLSLRWFCPSRDTEKICNSWELKWCFVEFQFLQDQDKYVKQGLNTKQQEGANKVTSL